MPLAIKMWWRELQLDWYIRNGDDRNGDAYCVKLGYYYALAREPQLSRSQARREMLDPA